MRQRTPAAKAVRLPARCGNAPEPRVVGNRAPRRDLRRKGFVGRWQMVLEPNDGNDVRVNPSRNSEPVAQTFP